MTRQRTHLVPTTKSPKNLAARAFIESAKDTGDKELLATARRVWWWAHFSATHTCSEADKAAFTEFRSA